MVYSLIKVNLNPYFCPLHFFSKSAFSQSVYSKSAFLQSVFSKSAFLQSVFSKSAFLQSVYSKLAFSQSVFSKSALSNLIFSSWHFQSQLFYKSISFKYKSIPNCFTKEQKAYLASKRKNIFDVKSIKDYNTTSSGWSKHSKKMLVVLSPWQVRWKQCAEYQVQVEIHQYRKWYVTILWKTVQKG